MSYRLAVDFGTSFTSAAVTSKSGEARTLPLEGGSAMPSAVFLADDGELLVGGAALNSAGIAPARLLRGPKRELGEQTVLLDSAPFAPEALVAKVLGAVLDEALRFNDGEEPAELVLTHPASWAGERRLEALTRSAARCGLPAPQLMSEPEAAARYFGDENLPSGAYVAVYDLGGGTFDTAVLTRREDGSFELASTPAGDERMGGEHFNRLLYHYIGAQQDSESWRTLDESREIKHQRARSHLLADVEASKRHLSGHAHADIAIGDPVYHDQRVHREDFERLIADEIERSIGILSRTIAGAGIEPEQLEALYLTGGASRTPLVQRLIEAALKRRCSTRDDPKTIVALGGLRRHSRPRKAKHAFTKPSLDALCLDPPGISGRAEVGRALSCTRGDWAPETGAVSLQWLRGPANGSAPYELDRWEAIPNADGEQYTPTEQDAKRRLAVVAIGHIGDREESALSQPTAAVGRKPAPKRPPPRPSKHDEPQPHRPPDEPAKRSDSSDIAAAIAVSAGIACALVFVTYTVLPFVGGPGLTFLIPVFFALLIVAMAAGAKSDL